MTRLRSFLLLGGMLLLGLAPAAHAVRTLPFHSSSWLTWMKPDSSAVGLYGGNLDGIMVFAYHFDQSDNVIEADPFVGTSLSRYGADRQNGRRPTFVTIVNDVASGLPARVGDVRHDGALVHRILSDPAKRAKHVQQLVALAPLADGIDIDYEALLPETYPYYTQFIKELRAALDAQYPGKLLSICAQPKTSTAVGPRGQAIDWRGIEPYVNIIRVLAYYYSYKGSAPGPVVSLSQAQKLTDFAMNNAAQGIPLKKLHMTFSMFGWDWAEGQPGEIVQYSDVQELIRRYNVTPQRDPVNKDITFRYVDESGVRHTVYIDDADSLIPKILQTLNQGVRHVDFWALGTGDPRLWQWIANNTTNFPDPEDDKTPVIGQLKPNVVKPGNPTFTMEVLGDNFERAAVVRINGVDRRTTFSSATRLSVEVLASDVASEGTAVVTVYNPVNKTTSNPQNLYIHAQPVISALSPTSARVEGAGFTLTVTGTGFSANSIVRWNDRDRPTTYVSPTQVTAAIDKTDLLVRGNIPVRVANPLNEGGLSVGKIFSVRLVPSVTAMNPGQTAAGGPAFTLTLQGTRFAPDSVVRWNGSDRPTVFVSSRTLRVSITAADIAAPGSAQIIVFNAAPGGTSEARTFIINKPGAIVPTIFGLNPAGVRPGAPDTTIRVIGRDFQDGAVVKWEGSARATTFVSGLELRFVVPASDLANPGKFSVTVTNPGPNGGTSAAYLFSVIASGPLITSVDPTSVSAGGPAFTLSIFGSDFGDDAVLTWNGAPRPTTRVSASQLTASIPASDVATPGAVGLTVVDKFGESPTYIFVVDYRADQLRLTNLNPARKPLGSPGFTLTLTGTGFVPSAKVRWNGSDRATTFISSTTLEASVLAPDLVRRGTAAVSVAQLNQTSNSLFFYVEGSTLTVNGPGLIRLSPSNARTGGLGFDLTVTGKNFTAASSATWNGVVRPVTFVSSTTLTFPVTPADLQTVGIATITVVDSGYESNPLPFEVRPKSTDPRIYSISPSSMPTNSPDFYLTVRGTNFTNRSVILFDGAPRKTLHISTSTIRALVFSTETVRASTITLQVIVGTQTSNTTSFFFYESTGTTSPALSLTSLAPGTTVAGSPAFLLGVTGTGFSSSTVVLWNGSPRLTTFVSSSSLRASIAAADVAAPSTATVQVRRSTQTSNGLSFVVSRSTASGGPAGLTLAGLNPGAVLAGSPAFDLAVTGTGFSSSTVILWNGSPRLSTFINETTVKAAIQPADVASPGAATVQVRVGAQTSNGQTFLILASTPSIFSLSPSTATAGDLGFTLGVRGAAFGPASVVRWNGADRTTVFVSSTELRAQIGDSDIARAGSARVTVFNPATGITSQAQTFLIYDTPKTAGVDNLGAARVFPNPWSADNTPNASITFDRLTPNSTIKIFTLSARSVRTLSVPGGSAAWDLRNDAGDLVASGYYVYVITDNDGHRARGKLAIVR